VEDGCIEHHFLQIELDDFVDGLWESAGAWAAFATIGQYFPRLDHSGNNNFSIKTIGR
jgi:hypothetical protein